MANHVTFVQQRRNGVNFLVWLKLLVLSTILATEQNVHHIV